MIAVVHGIQPENIDKCGTQGSGWGICCPAAPIRDLLVKEQRAGQNV